MSDERPQEEEAHRKEGPLEQDLYQAQQPEATTPADQAAQAPGLRPGWSVPRDHLPRPTYWPVVMALGITFMCFGVVTTFIISAVGLILFIISTVGWIGDIRNEQREHAGDH